MTGIPRGVILGGGGHAAAVIDALQGGEQAVPHAVLDADSSLWGRTVLGVPIVGGDDCLIDLKHKGITMFVIGLGGTADNKPRRRLFESALAQGLTPLTVVHRSAICSSSAEIGRGTVILAGAIVGPRAVLRQNVLMNSGAIVEHDCDIGDHVHIAPGAVVASTVRVGTAAHIGAGSIVRQGLTIGESSVVGMGAVVTKDVQPGETVIGVPARPTIVVQRS